MSLSSSIDHSLQFRDEIDRAESVLGNATPCAIRQVPALGSRATSHARVLRQLTVAEIFRSARKKQPIFFLENLRSCVPQAKKSRLLGPQNM